MKQIIKLLKANPGKLISIIVIVFLVFLGLKLYNTPVSGFENKFIYLLKEYGYIILFAWSILEGELGLIMAGLMSHNGSMNLYLAIFVAGLGGFCGDQLYFYLGRYNKTYVFKKFRKQRRKLALAHLMLQRHGWPIIFMQRYMYGMRTIIPIAIGITGYSNKKFAFINLISSMCWAGVSITPIWYFGKEVFLVIDWAKAHWYYALPFVLIAFVVVIFYVLKFSKRKGKNEY